MVRIVDYVFNLYALGLVVYTILTWLSNPRLDAARKWLEQWYAPFLGPLRRLIPPVDTGRGRLDFAPLVLLIVIIVTRQAVISLLYAPF